MNEELQQYARKCLKEKIITLSEAHQLLFKQMYSHNNLDLSIEEVIDNMNESKLDWAMKQVENTLKKLATKQ